jgi:hypothetical protein
MDEDQHRGLPEMVMTMIAIAIGFYKQFLIICQYYSTFCTGHGFYEIKRYVPASPIVPRDLPLYFAPILDRHLPVSRDRL